MAEFPGGKMMAIQYLPAVRQTAAHAGADSHICHRFAALSLTQYAFTQGRRVGIVL